MMYPGGKSSCRTPHRGETLWAEYAACPDRHQREQLVQSYRPLIMATLRRLRCDEDEDLQQVAWIGLLKAIDRFDPSRGNSFSSYAVPTIAGEVKRYLRDHSRTLRPPRFLLELRDAVSRREAELAASTGCSPTLAEIAESLGVELEQVVEAMAVDDICRPGTLDRIANVLDLGPPIRLEELVGEEDPALTSADTRVLVRQAIQTLSPRLQELITLRYYEHLSQEEAGERLGISQMQISRLERRALSLLRELISGELCAVLVGC